MATCPKCKNQFSSLGSNIVRIESLADKQTLILCPHCQSILKEVLDRSFKFANYLVILVLIAAFTFFSLKHYVAQEMPFYSHIIAVLIILWILSPFFTKYVVIEFSEDGKETVKPEKPWYKDRTALHLGRRILLLILLSWYLLEDTQALGWINFSSLDYPLGLTVVLISSLIAAFIIIYPLI